MRTFIAIDIPPTKEIQELQSDIFANLKGVDIKYTDKTQHHITLSFLGDTSAEQVSALCASLETIKCSLNRMDIHLRGIGVFKSGQKPSAVWVGIEPNTTLDNLWFDINKRVEADNIKIEKRKFSPHLTLGRIKRIEPMHNLAYFKQKYQKTLFGKIPVTEFVFYQSILTQQGPIYKPIRKFML